MNLETRLILPVPAPAATAEAAQRPLLDEAALGAEPFSGRQGLLAVALLVSMAAGVALTAPFAGLALPGSSRFLPAYAAAILINDVVTAALLLAQYRAYRRPGMLLLAFGFLFCGLTAAPWALSFPGAFSDDGLLGGGPQTTAVIAAFRRLAFPAAALGYMLAQLRFGRPAPAAGAERRIALGALAAVAATVAVTLLATLGHPLAPRFMADPLRITDLWMGVAAASALMSAAALAIGIRLMLLGRRCVVELWLCVALVAGLAEVLLMSWLGGGVRYGVGWWAGRVCGLLSASVVMLALLAEITALRTRLVRSLLAERQARAERLATLEALSAAMAHELNQPLQAVVTGARTAWRWLDRPEPDFAEARESLDRVAAEGDRAARIVDSLRRAFDRRRMRRAQVDPGALAAEAAALTADRARAAGARVTLRVAAGLPPVFGDETQLRQVLANLVANAVDAVAPVGGGQVRIEVRPATGDELPRHAPPPRPVFHAAAPAGVTFAVVDDGVGEPAGGWAKMFEPFVSTKPDGMGVGLLICRTVVEAHGGRLVAGPNVDGPSGPGAPTRGARVAFALPAMETPA